MADYPVYCQIVPKKLIGKRIQSGKYKMTNLGLEQKCSLCGEYWPADTEFFYTGKANHGLHPHCKACYDYNRRMKRQLAKKGATHGKKN